jgi:uncharacterized protein (TIGR03437 family)
MTGRLKAQSGGNARSRAYRRYAGGPRARSLRKAINFPRRLRLFGKTPAKSPYFGLAPNFVGLYQFNVTVPAVADGRFPLILARAT